MKHRMISRIKQEVGRLLDANEFRHPPVDVGRIVKKLGVEFRREAFEGEVSGLLFRDGKRTIIAVNALHHRNRQRFTTAHEIGHLILHKVDIHVDKGFQMVLRDTESSRATDVSEIEANQFAAELLMPEQMIRRDAPKYLQDFENDEGLTKLANRYGVSSQAMAFRLANLDMIKIEA